MSIVLITHDLGVVAGLCSRVLVMYAGQIVEEGPVERIFANPQHPYTVGLLRSVPRLHVQDKARLQPIGGTPPDLRQPPLGCGFYARCPHAMRVCESHRADLFPVEPNHRAACWLHHPAAPRIDIAATLEVS